MADMLYAYGGERVVFVDLPRSQEDYVSYAGIEKLKDGVYMTTKYESCSKLRAYPVHVVVTPCAAKKFKKRPLRLKNTAVGQ